MFGADRLRCLRSFSMALRVNFAARIGDHRYEIDPILACALFLARIVDGVMCLGRFTTLIRPDEVVCPCCRRSYRRSRLEEREVTGVGMQSNIATHGMGPVPLRAIICKSCFQAIHPFDRVQRPCCHAAFPRSFGPSPRLSSSSFGRLFNSRSGVTAWSFLACP